MEPQAGLTLLILQLNRLLDTGRYDSITLNEVVDHANDGSILRFIKERAGDDFDLSFLVTSPAYGDFESFFVEGAQSLINVADPSRKWCVERRGLCLALAWANELLQQWVTSMTAELETERRKRRRAERENS